MVPIILALVQIFSLPLSFDQAKAAADGQLASLPIELSVEFGASLSNFVGTASNACARPRQSLSDFAVVLFVDKDGKVKRTWRRGDSVYAYCIEAELATADFMLKPSVQPFFISYEFTAKANGSNDVSGRCRKKLLRLNRQDPTHKRPAVSGSLGKR